MYKNRHCSIVCNCEMLGTTRYAHCCRRGDINYGYVHKMKCYAGAVKMSEVVLSSRKVCPNMLLDEKSKLQGNM